jgi:hypothetical protein
LDEGDGLVEMGLPPSNPCSHEMVIVFSDWLLT